MTRKPVAWRIEIPVTAEALVAAVEPALEGIADAVTAMEIASGPDWRVEALTSTLPDRAILAARLGVAAASYGIAPPEFAIEPVFETDWVRRVQADTPPVAAGRFYVHGSHVDGPVPDGLIGIRIDAGAAFGTGTHESTRGCLVAFARLAADLRVARALDLGTGSGILAIAAAKLWRTAVLATDNDAIAAAVAAENAVLNGVAEQVRAIRSDGFRNAAIRGAAPFDLIAANILARPLIRMAPTIARYLAPDGRAVLSGILSVQAADVAAAAQRAGMTLADRVTLGDWDTLILRREPQ